MTGWTTHSGTAVALDRENLDTDQLCPARFMSTPRAQGYGAFLLHDLRHHASGEPVATMPLNHVPQASILVAGRNFGSGSSREAAVYALVDFGIRAVLAPSFGDIFAANAVNNGLLPARISDADAAALIAAMPPDGSHADIDLETATATIAGRSIGFDLDPAAAEKLRNGWDDIDLTRQHRREIAAYRAVRALAHPWAFPPVSGPDHEQGGNR